MKSFETLVQGLAGCAQLKELEIEHPQLLELHAGVAALSMASDGPRLKEVRIGSYHCKPDQAAPFLLTLQQLSKLSVIGVMADFETLDTLKAELLEPLRGHSSLIRLAVSAPNALRCDQQSDQFVPTLLSFASTCPHLRHLVMSNVDIPSDGAFGAAQKFLLRGGRLEASNAAEATAAAFAQGVALKSLVLGGVFLTPAVVTAIAHGLERNTSLESVDVSGALTDLESLMRLLDAVKNSKSILSFTIPKFLEDLYFRSPDGSVHEFEPRSLLSLDGKPLPFKLMFQAGVTEEAKATANKALALLEERANNIGVDIEMHRRRMLEPFVSGLMNAAMLAQPQGADYSFSHVAPSVVSALAKNDLSNAFRLNEVKKPKVVESAPTTTTTMITTGTTTTTTTGSTTTTSTTATTTSGLQLTTSLRQ
ncbi:hypothetical protein [Hydrogenophaga sp.]|uniref:hypothetical protein n=1 Tax=Hydrogenophaga sp. TaxID=1904254 RepID=UPI0027203F4B|nr:hypothetical protein [Hydrogenophaga sp.]MDO9434062.1 hypothetical protein [Hydrogenophaga sp.]